MARIVEFSRYGGPEVLQIKEVPTPVPGPNEVRIRVKAIGLNRAESMWRKGAYVEEVRLPARLGYESAGIVEAIGEAVTHVAVGDAVSTVPSFSLNDYGMYGDQVLAPTHAVVKKLASLSFAEAVAVWNPYITPYGAMIESGLLSANDVVLIPAASSSVGLGAIQLVNMMGATSIALTRTSAKREQLLAAGAQHVIATEEEDLVAEVMRITDNQGATLAFDPVGGSTLAKLISALAPGGHIFLYGALSEEATVLPILDMIAKKPNIHGYNLFGTTTVPELQKAAVEFIHAGLESGKLKPLIERTFAFEDIVEAHRFLEKSEHLGRIVVTVG
ncbi:MAG: zinc-dependent alcohol dehydrogenase family protein [Pseudomonas sp.]|nr:zinc-dependent alcohol dehydrogenase family protein [Pseudomonas sp.]